MSASFSADPNTSGAPPLQEQKPPEQPKPRMSPAATGATRGMPPPTAALSDRLEQDRAEAEASKPVMPVIQKPPKQEANTDPFQAFGQPAMWIAALGSLFTRRPFVNAIQAMGGVLKATSDKDAALAKQKYDEWKIESANALKLSQYQEKVYDSALKKMSTDAAAGRAELQTSVLAYKDEVLQQAYAHGGIDEVKNLLFARKKQTAATQAAQAGTETFLQGHIAVAEGLGSDDPTKQAEAIDVLRKQMRADSAGKGSTVATRQSTDLNDVRLDSAKQDILSGDPALVERGQRLAESILQLGAGALKPASAAAGTWQPFTDPETGAQGYRRNVSGKPEYTDLQGNAIEAPKGISKIGSSQPATISPEDAHILAQSADAGNYQPLAGLARTPANIGLVDKELGEIIRARGGSGADLADATIRFHAAMAEQTNIARVGSKLDIGAQELSVTIPQAREASQKVVRWGFFGADKLRQALQGQADDPDLADFALANQAVANGFAGVATRSGASTEGARQHAYDLLSIARTDAVYQRQMDRLEKEAQAMLTGTAKARQDSQANFRAGLKPDLTQQGQAAHDVPLIKGDSHPVVLTPGREDGDYDALPSGTLFVGPDGIVRKKP